MIRRIIIKLCTYFMVKIINNWLIRKCRSRSNDTLFFHRVYLSSSMVKTLFLLRIGFVVFSYMLYRSLFSFLNRFLFQHCFLFISEKFALHFISSIHPFLYSIHYLWPDILSLLSLRVIFQVSCLG